MAYTADAIILRPGRTGPEVLMIRRRYEPFQGHLALPGGYVDRADMDAANDPTSEITVCAVAAAREAGEETSVAVTPDQMIWVGRFDAVDRDPRGRRISNAYMVWVDADTNIAAGDDAKTAEWWPVRILLAGYPMAFDHLAILSDALVPGPQQTVELGSGYVETDIPPHSYNPDSWTWTEAITLYHVDHLANFADPVNYPAAVKHRYGRLIVTAGEPRELNEFTDNVRQHAPHHRAGSEVVLGEGTLRLRSRLFADDWDQDRRHQWNGDPANHHGYTALGFADESLNEEAMRALFNQWVSLRFEPVERRECRGFATCDRLISVDEEYCGYCREDGWSNECASCGAPGGRGRHDMCGSCHDFPGLCEICYPDTEGTA